MRGSFVDARLVRTAKRALRDGQHRNPTGEPDHFTTPLLHHPEELQAEVLEAGFSIQALLAVEGAAVFLEDLVEQWQDSARRQWILEVVRWLEVERSTIGVPGHVAAVALKPR